MFRQITIFCIATLTVLSAVSYSQAQEDDIFVTSPTVQAPQPPGTSAVLWDWDGRNRNEDGELSPTAKANRQLRTAQQRLAKAEDEKAKEVAIAEVRKALGAYFDVDLERRQSELAAIKKRVAEMEGQLKKRVDAKEDIIALRLQVLLNDADGLGWSYNGFKENTGGSRRSFGGRSYGETAVPAFRNALPTSSSIAPLAEPQN